MRLPFNLRALRANLPIALLVVGGALFGFGVGAAIFGLGGDDEGAAAVTPTTSMPGMTMPGMTMPQSGGSGTLPAHPVAGNFKPDDTKLAECRGDQRCFEQALGNILYYQGPAAAFKVFDQMMQSDTAFRSGCHRVAHTIGSAALARYKGNVAEAFVRGSSSCASGYYHGILEHSFLQADAQTVDDFGAVARSLCSDPKVHDRPFLLFQCIHGLGHGLMIRSGYDLPFSLEVCDKLETDWDQRSCHGGAFMENISSSYGVRSQWLRDDDLIYPCRTVKESQKEGCYLIVTSRILGANGYDWKDAARVCRTSDADWVDVCFQSFGRDAAGTTLFDAAKSAGLCKIAGDEAPECFYGASRAIANNHADPATAAPLCELAPKASKPRCYEGVGTYVANFNLTRETRRAACARITDAYYKECLQGAGERAPGVSA